MLPEALGHVRLVLEELRVALLRRILASQFTIHLVATVLQHYATTLEILRCTILSLVLALRVCAYLLNQY
jgi:hypothetical protein